MYSITGITGNVGGSVAHNLLAAGQSVRAVIGLMVAYAYAAQFPAEVEKLVVMDAFLPGVSGW
jgi:nucleoside-diphosphate-sugar epimerase